MNFRILEPVALLLTLTACDARRQSTEPVNRVDPPAARATIRQEQATPPAPGADGGLPNDPTQLAEPQGQIDPKGGEAAGQIVQQFAALIEQQRYDEAAKLWFSTDGRKSFDQAFGDTAELHMQIGKPGVPEGAAGSAYVDIPVVMYGKRSGKSFTRAGTAVLRRVNDVPGSTEEQRRWRIERIDIR
jgi:hypothetical protein